MEQSGSPFHTSMDLMHTQVDLLGDLTPRACTITQSSTGTVAKAQLATKDNGSVGAVVWGVVRTIDMLF